MVLVKRTTERRRQRQKKERKLTEGERNDEPGRVIQSARGRDERRTIEEHRDIDILEPRRRVSSLPIPERYGEERSNDHGVDVTIVFRSGTALSRRPHKTPVFFRFRISFL